MAAIKTSTNKASGSTYTVTSAAGNRLQMQQRGAILILTIGGQELQLSQQNAVDLLPGISNFANYGVVF